MSNTDYVKVGVGYHAHTMLVGGFREFNTRDEDHFLFYQVTKPEKIVIPPLRWLFLDIESTIEIITNK